MDNFSLKNINWSIIDHVFFDMDGTLLDLHFDSHFWMESVPVEYAKKNKLKDSLAYRKEMYERIMSKRGTLEWYCLDFWEENLGLDIMAMKQEIAHKIKPLPHVMSFLEFLKVNEVDVWLTTNAHRKGLDLKFEKTNIEEYFSHIISSHDYGYPKESQNFWKTLNNKHSFNSQNVVFFDDSEAVISSATKFGIGYPILMLKPDSTKQATKQNDNFSCIESFSELMINQL